MWVIQDEYETSISHENVTDRGHVIDDSATLKRNENKVTNTIEDFSGSTK
jgi:hypothetical protein